MAHWLHYAKTWLSSTKQEVHNILWCRLGRTEQPRPQVTSTEKFLKCGHVFEICALTDRHSFIGRLRTPTLHSSRVRSNNTVTIFDIHYKEQGIVEKRQTSLSVPPPRKLDESLSIIFDSGIFGPLYGNMTPFTKPEVHKILHWRLRRIESRPQVTWRENLLKLDRWFFDIFQRTDKRTNKLEK